MKFILVPVLVLMALVPAVGHAEQNYYLEQANLVRSQPVAWSADLAARAAARAQALCALPFAHTGWQASFDGGSYGWIGENLAQGFANEQQRQAAWLASPTHKANIVADKFTLMGVGYADCGDAPDITVQLFASL